MRDEARELGRGVICHVTEFGPFPKADVVPGKFKRGQTRQDSSFYPNVASVPSSFEELLCICQPNGVEGIFPLMSGQAESFRGMPSDPYGPLTA